MDAGLTCLPVADLRRSRRPGRNRQRPRRHEQWQAGALDPSGIRTVQHRSRDCPTRLCRTAGARLYRLHDKVRVQPKGPARHRMASDLVDLRCHRRTSQQEVHELGPRKTKRGIKISGCGIKSEPACGVNQAKLASRRLRLISSGQFQWWSLYQSRAHIYLTIELNMNSYCEPKTWGNVVTRFKENTLILRLRRTRTLLSGTAPSLPAQCGQSLLLQSSKRSETTPRA